MILLTAIALDGPAFGSLEIERFGKKNIVINCRYAPPYFRIQYEYWIDYRGLGSTDFSRRDAGPPHSISHRRPSPKDGRYYGEIDVSFSLWTPGILFSILPIISLVRHSRKKRLIADRLRRGQCTKCGYDLRGTDDGVCSECGTPFSCQRMTLERESEGSDSGSGTKNCKSTTC